MAETKNSTLALTSARGIAAWWVVFYHFKEAMDLSENSAIYALIAKGHLAVDFFFILSGFVIFLNYGDWFVKTLQSPYLKFIGYRLSRVYPLYIIVLFLHLLNPLALHYFSSSGNVGEGYGIGYFVASVFMVQNWGGFRELAWNIPAWSISVEFAAYLLFPIIAFLIIRLKTTWIFCTSMLFVVGATLQYFHMLFGYASLGDGIGDTGLIRCLTQFIIGCYLAKAYQTGFLDRISGFAVGVIGLLFGLSLYGSIIPDFYAIPVLFSCAVVALLKCGDGIFVARPLIWLGDVSYSTYIIHYFVKDWVKFLSQTEGLTQFVYYIVIVFLSSIILYRYIEVPGREYFKGLTNKVLA